MSEPTVDVLKKSFDRLERYIADDWGSNSPEAMEAREARAAVAELIDAARDIDSSKNYIVCVCGRDHTAIKQSKRDRLRAALARVGGAS